MSNNTVQAGKRSKQKVLDYQRVFGTEEGKRVLYDLMSDSSFMNPTLGKNNDPLEMAFNEGKRNVILRILAFTRMDVSEIDKLIEEGQRNAKELYRNIRASATRG